MSNIIDSIRLSGTTYQIQGSGGGGTQAIELTQAQYDALVDKDPNVFYIITDAEAGDLTNYYTKTETNTLLGGKADTATTYTKTEVNTALASKADTATTYTKQEVDNAITAATSTKQDTLVSGTNIKTINNESILGSGNIDIQGGSTYTAGRGISIANDTISFSLPISAGTGVYSIAGGNVNGNYINIASARAAFAFGMTCSATTPSSFSVGYSNLASGGASSQGNFAQGYMTTASGNRCHSEGLGTSSTADASHSEGHNTVASGNYSHSEGEEVKATNVAEHSQGRYNVSNKASTTFGDSGNTLFSVGNGTADNARHNAFEIRQNGDIYLTLDGQDVKLQDQLGGGGSSYTAGDGIDITNDVISVTGKVDTSTYNTYTAATDTALNGKQATLVSGTNIKTINNESILGSGNIDIQGGGKAIEAGRGISITTGETADTVSFNLPISAGTGTNSLIVGCNSSDSFWKPTASGRYSIAHGSKCTAGYEASIATGYYNEALANYSIAQGYHTTTYGGSSHSEGWDSVTRASYSHAEGNSCITNGESSHAEGIFTNTSNKGEHSEGWYNVTRKNSTTFGDSGNTLFSVGNGTADNARHNAFEIRQNGDIYLNDGSKLQDTVSATTANTTALGGLSLVKLTQAEYDALATKDNSTLYVIVN